MSRRRAASAAPAAPALSRRERRRQAAASGEGARRLPVLATVAAAMLVLAVADAVPGSPSGVARLPTAPPSALPTADDDGALTSTWYCAAGTAVEGGGADLSLVLANAGDEQRTGTVTWVPASAERVTTPVQLGPRSSMQLLARDAVQAPSVSAVVELSGGGVVVEHVVESNGARAAAACASAASTDWYLANGSTARDAVESLVLFNPFPDDAIVDIGFATEDGRLEPEPLQGLLVAAGSSRAAELSTVGPLRREVTATEVHARSGRVVVDRLQTFNGVLGRKGIDLSLAAAAPALSWTFPIGVQTGEGAQRWHVFNPGDQEAVVSIEVVLDEGAPPEPVELSVLPNSQIVFPTDASAYPLPVEVGHVATIRSLNGVPVVAERQLDVRGTGTGAGWSSMLGAPSGAERWVLAYGREGIDETVAIANTGPDPVTVLVRRLQEGRVVALDGLSTVELPPAGRTTVALPARALAAGDDGPLVTVLVEADGPVAVERRLTGAGVGATSALGVPLA